MKTQVQLPKCILDRILMQQNLSDSKKERRILITAELYYLAIGKIDSEVVSHRYTSFSSSRLLRRYGSSYISHIKWLQDKDIIKRRTSYTVNKECKQFRFNIVDNHEIVSYTITKKPGIKALNKKIGETPLKNTIKRWVQLTLENCSVDWQMFEDMEYKLNDTTRAMRSRSILERIELGELRMNDSWKNNRLYHSFCYAASEYRKCIMINNEKTVTFDIVNSQPCMAALMFREQERFFENLKELMKDFEGFNFTDDMEQFCKDCLQGDFYEIFQKKFELDRKETKRLMFKYMFGSVKDENDEMTAIMIQLYPNVHNIFSMIKTKNDFGKKYNALAILLQKIEADFVFEIVGEKLRCAGIPFITVHDSWTVKKSDRNKVNTIIDKVFEEQGFTLPITID